MTYTVVLVSAIDGSLVTTGRIMPRLLWRRWFRVLVALPLPITVGAQSSAHTPGDSTTTVVNQFKAFGAEYAAWLVAAFDSIPSSKYDFRPTAAQQSVGYIAQHLEDANYGLCQLIGGIKHPTTAKDSLPDTVKASWPKDTLVARLRSSFHFCGAAGAALDDAKLAAEVPERLSPNGKAVPRVRYLLFFVTDLAEHYAQIASYMRLMGLIPPSAHATH